MKKLIFFFFCSLCLHSAEEEVLSTTNHRIETYKGELQYSATTGFIHDNSLSKKKCSIFYTYYQKQGKKDPNRPITFCFNGGPGSSSVWLHMGAFGPKRFLTQEEGQKATLPKKWITNEETLLYDTDLVFIDPVGTGFSSTENQEDLSFFCSAEKDIESIGEFIRSFLTSNKRWLSPKYLAGESYGTTRAAALSEYLHNEGVFLRGLILISVAIDLTLVDSIPAHFLCDILRFPSYAATAWYYGRLEENIDLESLMEKTKRFAFQKYFPLLFQGTHAVKEEKEKLLDQLSYYTSINKEHFHPKKSTIDLATFAITFLEDEKIGLYDARMHLPTQELIWDFSSDASTSSMSGIFTAGFNAYLAEELNLIKLNPYQMLSWEVHKNWKFPHSFGKGFSTLDSLQKSIETNPELKIFVASGYYDLVTPFAAAEYLFSHLYTPYQNVEIHNYEGGHMIYLDRKAHLLLDQDLHRFFQKKS